MVSNDGDGGGNCGWLGGSEGGWVAVKVVVVAVVAVVAVVG